MQRKVVLSFAVLLCLTAVAQAVPLITVGNHILQPNMAGQTIDILVSGGDAVAGTNFRAQVGDGGPPLGGVDVAPSMTGSIIAAGTIFAPNNTGMADLSIPPLYVELVTTTSAGTVAASGVVAKLTFDTTGFAGGSWVLSLNTLGGPTDFGLLAADLQDGSITIVPEPSSVVLGLFAVAGFGAVVIRKRRASRA